MDWENKAMNLLKAARIIEFVQNCGVVDFCLCAGARNSPLITLLDENKSSLEAEGSLFHFFDERSAAFFALGRAQQSNRPVAIITTSGTATTELISAAVEAFYTQTPLIFITADRPPSYRKTGAPQSIEQIGIFSHYSLPTVDLYDDDSFAQLQALKWRRDIPLHLNVCFAEPLLTGPIPTLKKITTPPFYQNPGPRNDIMEIGCEEGVGDEEVARDEEDLRREKTHGSFHNSPQFFSECKKPFIIVGGLQPEDRPWVCHHLQNWPGPWWIETLSGLRGHPALEDRRIKSSERLLQHLLALGEFDGVIRIGSVPTTRLWRDLEERFRVPVITYARGQWSGLARPSEQRPLEQLQEVNNYYLKSSLMARGLGHQWQQTDLDLVGQINSILEANPHSEMSLVQQLSHWIGDSPLYLGNSLPIREWDWVARPQLNAAVSGNRGANGIDGQFSTFLGWKPNNLHAWALLGDLTTLYDLNAPWILSQVNRTHFTLVIMNNSGGHIFKAMFGREAFLNRHPIDFAAWSQMWGLNYLCLDRFGDQPTVLPQVLELRPDEQATDKVRQEIEGLWKKHLL